jgi:hypothetical protein
VNPTTSSGVTIPAAVRQQLEKEFAESVPKDRIDAVADSAIKSFGDLKVHAFISVLAFRRAWEFLRRNPEARDSASSG